MIAPLLQACSHAPTPQETARDRDYMGCRAKSGQPCIWAKRYDGFKNPPYHSERWEAALAVSNREPRDIMAQARMDQAILKTGEV